MNRHELPPVKPPTEPWIEREAPPVKPPTEPWMIRLDTKSQFVAPW